MDRSQLARVRWAVRAVLVLGVAASVAANILHARPNPISQGIAAWPPLALLLTVELIAKVPVHRRAQAIARIIATAAIAGIAAWVSYWHMAGVAARYGEATKGSGYLLPLTVDGLIVVASVCLVELGGRLQVVAEAGRLVASVRDNAPVVARSDAPVAAPPARTEPSLPASPSTPAAPPVRATRQSAPAGDKSPRPGTSRRTAPVRSPVRDDTAPDRADDAMTETITDHQRVNAPPQVNTSGPADGPRRTATEQDALAIAASRPVRNRNELRAALAELGLSASNDRLGPFLGAIKARTDDTRPRNGHPVLD